jgi:hypothetical protein
MHATKKSTAISGETATDRRVRNLLSCSIVVFSLRQENHDLRQKLELQSTENDENHNSLRRRFQDSISELTSQVEALGKGKTR